MDNPVSSFEIPVRHLEREVAFSGADFGWVFERARVGGNHMAWFSLHEGGRGISGALAQGGSHLPGPLGARLHFSHDDLAATLERVEQARGRVLRPVTENGGLGRVAGFEDNEGKVVALHLPREP